MYKYSRHNRVLKGLTALFVGYALVVHLLLAGAVATKMALANATGPFEICYNSDASGIDSNGKTQHNTNHVPCLVCAFASLSAPIPIVSNITTCRIAASTSYDDRQALAVTTAKQFNPRTSQGPPQIA